MSSINRKLEGSEPVAGSEPAPEVTKERFFEVDVDFSKPEEATASSVKSKTTKVEKAGQYVNQTYHSNKIIVDILSI